MTIMDMSLSGRSEQTRSNCVLALARLLCFIVIDDFLVLLSNKHQINTKLEALGTMRCQLIIQGYGSPYLFIVLIIATAY